MMKATILFLGVCLLFAFAQGDESPTCAPAQAEDVAYSDDEINNMLFCLANGVEFNGKKTCQVGCRVACQQPGCGGFAECIQIPNERLHKYRCRCNSS